MAKKALKKVSHAGPALAVPDTPPIKYDISREGDDVGDEAQQVREADLLSSQEQLAASAHHSAEALVVAGLGAPVDPDLVAVIAAVQTTGATGLVGWVTATKIEAAINGYKNSK